jgi:hypothetical protein
MPHATRRPNVLAALLIAAVLVSAPLARAADAPGAFGTWDVVATTPNGDMPSVITINKVAGNVKAEIEIEGLKRTVTDETLEGGVLRMKVQYDAGIYDVEAKIDGDAMEGSWQGGGYSGTLKAKRRP